MPVRLRQDLTSKRKIIIAYKLYVYYTCACTCFGGPKLVCVYSIVSDDRRITSLNGSVLSLHLGGLVHEYYINAGEFHWLNVTNHVKYERE